MSAPAMRPTASVSISGDHGRTPPQRSKKVVAAARRGRNGAAPRVSVTASTAGGPVELLPALKRQPRGMAQPTPRSLRNDRAGHRRGAVSAARRVQRTLARRVLFPAMSLSLRAIRCRSASARVRGGGIERLPGTQRVEQLRCFRPRRVMAPSGANRGKLHPSAALQRRLARLPARLNERRRPVAYRDSAVCNL